GAWPTSTKDSHLTHRYWVSAYSVATAVGPTLALLFR
ncbi:MAG: hypothetical protein QOE61_3820, partial [Micromonosporaceae bacterium]|nr:hypothetical protein [Micromonosporaceae bacterium]